MPRKQPQKIGGQEKYNLLDNLWTMIALLETREEVKNFFKDLLSETESVMIARRIEIAKRLLREDGYDDIIKSMKVSPSTIASVHRWLQGGFGGFEKGIERLEKEVVRKRAVEEKREEGKTPFSTGWVRKKYPMHYFLANIINDKEDLAPPKKLRKK